MKKAYIIIFLWCTLGAKPEIAQIKSPESLETRVKKIITPWMQQHAIPGVAVALYALDAPHLLHYGYADHNKKNPVTQDTIFEIGSVSKVFTCLLLAQEIIAGRMRLADPISLYIPGIASNKNLNTITLEKLGVHASTMPVDIPTWVNSHDTFIAYMRTWKPSHAGTLWFQYSNPGIDLLRLALEESTHEAFNNLLIKKLLSPLHMNPLGVSVPKKYMQHYAHCINKKGEPARYWDDPVILGSGGLRASSADMLKFLKAALGLPGTPAAIKQAMELTQRPYISISNMHHGLGWEIRSLNKLTCPDNIFWGFPAKKIDAPEKLTIPHLIIEKTGTTRGFHAYIGIIPEKNIGVVIMINRTFPSGWSSIKKIARKILFDFKDE